MPSALLVYRIQGDQIVPAFLGERDHPWLRCVLDERERFVGRPRRELAMRMKEPLAVESPARRRRLVAHVLDTLATRRTSPDTSPQAIRAILFRAARGMPPRDETIGRVAADLGLAPDQLEQALFADLPGEQEVAALTRTIATVDLTARTNLALARALLARASRVRIRIDGNALPVIRLAKLRGLIVNVEAADDGRAILDISGPLSLFHHTRVYGHALGELVPQLVWCNSFQLEAACQVAEGTHTLRLSSADPIFPADEPRRYDSLVERRFAADILRAALDWDLVRDPQPLVAGKSLVFPDFALVHRAVPTRRWLVEIVGFWTPDYLRRKLDAYRLVDAPDLILCIDERRRCAEGDLPPGARVVWYRKRIDAKVVRAMIDA